MANSENSKREKIQRLIQRIKAQIVLSANNTEVEQLVDNLYYLREPSDVNPLKQVRSKYQGFTSEEVKTQYEKILTEITRLNNVDEIEPKLDDCFDLLDLLTIPNLIKDKYKEQPTQLQGSLGKYDFTINKLLRKLMRDGGNNNFIILKLDGKAGYYLQFSGVKGDTRIRFEVVGNKNLASEHQLSTKTHHWLLNYGWALDQGEEEENYYRWEDLDSEKAIEQIIEILQETTQEAFGNSLSQQTHFTLNLE